MLSILLFAVLSVILLWFLVGTKGKWQYKVPLIIIVPFLGFLTHQIPDTYRGWPTSSVPASTSTYIGGIVEEPDGSFKGAIYLWLIPARGGSSDHGLGYTSKNGEPRAYVVAYSRQLHKQVDAANSAVKKGGAVQAKISRPGKKSSGAHVPKFLVRLYQLPPGLPPKAVPTNP